MFALAWGEKAKTHIEAKRDETKSRPPDSDNLRSKISSDHAEVASQAYQPVRANSAKEDHMPLWRDLLGCRKCDGLFLVRGGVENAAIASDDRYNEERAGKITKEGDSPVYEHLDDADTLLNDSYGREHERASTQVETSNHDNTQTVGEDKGGERSDQTRCILLERDVNIWSKL
jgi:hypothetical protein